MSPDGFISADMAGFNPVDNGFGGDISVFAALKTVYIFHESGLLSLGSGFDFIVISECQEKTSKK